MTTYLDPPLCLVAQGLPATSQGDFGGIASLGSVTLHVQANRPCAPLVHLRQRPVCSLRGRLLCLWKTGNGPGFPQAEPSTPSRSGDNLRSKLTEADVVELVLLEQLHGQKQQAIGDVSNGATDGLSSRSTAEVQITELGIDSDRL